MYDRVHNISNATEIANKPISTELFKQVYHEIQRADFLERLPKYEYIKQQSTLGFAQNQMPLSILIIDFETIKKSALRDKTVFLNSNNDFESKNTNVFDKHNLRIMAPLLNNCKGLSVDFILKDNLMFNTTNETITSIIVNFNNGDGFQNIVINKVLKVNFKTIGNQKIDFRITLSNGEIINQSSNFKTQEAEYTTKTNRLASPNSILPNVVTGISSTIPFQGYGETAAFIGEGQYKLFPDTVNGILDKPIILLDGFDPGDTRSCDLIYSLLNYGAGQNLATDLRAQGFDIIILNFPIYTRPSTTTVIDGGVDYIQRNAMILVNLLNQINGAKVGLEKNVVIGPSMGGLIARYGLRYMELNALNHDTRLYISFDSPHYGANVPIGLQHLLNYMAYGPLGSSATQPIVDGMLKSPAAREMLIDHLEGHLQTGNATNWQTTTASLLPVGCPNYRTAFQNQLNTMGFPTTTRNVAIVNGAGNGSMTGTPGMSIMNHTFVNATNSSQRAVIQLHFTPTTNTTLEVSNFAGQQSIFGFWITGYSSTANSTSPTYTAGLDAAPGGKFDMSALTANTTDPTLIEFANNLLINYFDFIPTWSALSITGTQNLYANFPASGSTTPFVAWSIPSVNENHITLNAQNKVFAINEILNGALGTQTNIFEDIFIQNPIDNALNIYSKIPISNAFIKITDILGKTIISKPNQNIEGEYQIPLSLSKGIYFLTLKNNEGSKIVKLIK